MCSALALVTSATFLLATLLFGHSSTRNVHTIVHGNGNVSYVPVTSSMHTVQVEGTRFVGALQGETEWWVHVPYIYIAEMISFTVVVFHITVLSRLEQTAVFLNKGIGAESNLAVAAVSMLSVLMSAEISNLIDVDQILMFMLLYVLVAVVTMRSVFLELRFQPANATAYDAEAGGQHSIRSSSKRSDNGRNSRPHSTRPTWFSLCSVPTKLSPLLPSAAARSTDTGRASFLLSLLPWVWVFFHYVRGLSLGPMPNNLSWILPPVLFLSVVPATATQPGVWLCNGRKRAWRFHFGLSFFLTILVVLVSVTVLTDVFLDVAT